MPTYWNYDQAMSLYPLPNLVVTADSYFPFTEQYAGCTVINPVRKYSSYQTIIKLFILGRRYHPGRMFYKMCLRNYHFGTFCKTFDQDDIVCPK